MSAAQDQISKESLELVSTSSFAVNVANYRSLLLSYEREVQTSPVDDKRSALIFKEVSMLQEIIELQMRTAGSNARSLGVPPEELKEVAAIYGRAFGLVAINYASKYEFIFNSSLDDYLAYVEKWPEATELHRMFAAQLRMARMTMTQLFRAPDAASLIAMGFVGLVSRLIEMWPQVVGSMPVGIVLGSGGPPKRPPGAAVVAPGGGGEENQKMEQRVSKMEVALEHLQKDLTEIKGDVKESRRETKADFADLRREAKSEFSSVRSDMRLDFRLLFGATIAVALGLAGLMSKGFHWF